MRSEYMRYRNLHRFSDYMQLVIMAETSDASLVRKLEIRESNPSN